MSIDLRGSDLIATLHQIAATNAVTLTADDDRPPNQDRTSLKSPGVNIVDLGGKSPHPSLGVPGTTAHKSTGWASPSLLPADLDGEATTRSLFGFSPSPSLSASHKLLRHSSSSATEVIQRFESLQSQSASYRQYKDWKESKWGEDNLDEVEFEDDDINLELSLPNMFARPLPFPSASDFWNAVESLQARLVACVLSVTDMVLSAEYYIARPGELLAACKAAVAVWVPKPPAWIAAPLMSVVMNGEVEVGAEEDEDDDDDCSEERSNDHSSDAGSTAMSVASQLAHRVQEHTSRMTQVVCGVALGLVAAMSFSLVYVFAVLRIAWRYIARGEGSTKAARVPNSWASPAHKGNDGTGSVACSLKPPETETPLRHRHGGAVTNNSTPPVPAAEPQAGLNTRVSC